MWNEAVYCTGMSNFYFLFAYVAVKRIQSYYIEIVIKILQNNLSEMKETRCTIS